MGCPSGDAKRQAENAYAQKPDTADFAAGDVEQRRHGLLHSAAA
jgi:hypothetical protein